MRYTGQTASILNGLPVNGLPGTHSPTFQNIMVPRKSYAMWTAGHSALPRPR